MEYIEKIFVLSENYVLLSSLIGFGFAFLESFIPILPLMGIVAINSAINGMLIGFISSWIGSVLGTISVFSILKYLFANRFNSYLINKISVEKYDRYILAIRKKEFLIIFLYYAFPFFPSTIMTILSSTLKIDIVKFAFPMMVGKLLMMFASSYVGSDFSNIVNNPIKIIILAVVSILLYIFANRIENKIQDKES